MEKKQDLVTSGTLTAAGGTYRQVKIMGDGKVNGDLDCDAFRVSGMARVAGNVKAETMKLEGDARVEGELHVGKAKIDGQLKADGRVQANEWKLNGVAKIGKSMSAEEAHIFGTIHVGGDCEAEKFSAKGGFQIEGMLNADEIEVILYGKCRASEIGGGKIRVSKTTFASGIARWFHSLLPIPEPRLEADVIEGDEIDLSHTQARVVRGRHVKIGEGCDIGLVEYSEALDAHPNARIGEKRQA